MQVVAIHNFNPLHVGCLGPNHVWGQSSIRHTSVKAMLGLGLKVSLLAGSNPHNWLQTCA